MCYTQTSRICCWVGISFVTELCLLGKCSAVLGSVHASRHARSAEEEWGSEALAVSWWCTAKFRKANRRGKKKISIYRKYYSGLIVCVVHGGPRVEVRSFFFSLLFSDQAWAFSFLNFFRGFSVELDMENTASIIYPFLWTVKLAVWGVCVCGFGVPFENKVFRLYKQPITSGWSGFPWVVRSVFP